MAALLLDAALSDLLLPSPDAHALDDVRGLRPESLRADLAIIVSLENVVHEPWITLLSIIMIPCGVLAAVNLLRAFAQDWMSDERCVKRKSPAKQCERGPKSRDCDRSSTLCWSVLVLVPALGTTVAMGQPAEPTEVASEPPAELPVLSTPDPEAHVNANAATKSPFSLQLNLDYTSAYFYRGIIQEDSGFILQPAAKLTINLHESEEWELDAYFAAWNSFHGQKTGAKPAGDFSEYWYESDLLGGLAFSSGTLSFAMQYVFLTSPSDAYETVEELNFTVGFDDSDLLGAFAFKPYALLAIETGADASDGAHSDTGTYLELGIGPGFQLDYGTTPITITFPASVGLSLEDYYQDATGDDDAFGLAQVGVKASIPLPMSTRYGAWTLNAGVSAILLGDHTGDYNGGNHEEVVATIGLQLNF